MRTAPALALLLVLSAAASGCGALPKGQPELRPQTLVLAVTGMTDPATSPARVEAALEAVSGVHSATVSWAERTVTVVTLGRCDPAELLQALRKQGFGAAAH